MTSNIIDDTTLLETKYLKTDQYLEWSCLYSTTNSLKLHEDINVWTS